MVTWRTHSCVPLVFHMPKIARFHKIGGPENLVLEDLPSWQPGRGEVKLHVDAIGLNRAEALYMRGQYFEQPVLPSRIGYEAAGTVEAVGPDVDESWLNKRVATIPGFSQNKYGVLGEEAIVEAVSLGEYPPALSSVEGAAVWMQYLTAYGALIHFGKVATGDFVIVTAASSSVGLAAIQLVKDAGATSIATTRTSKKKYELLALGADHVIATEEEDLPKQVAAITNNLGARIIFDPVAGPYVETLAQAASNGGTLFVYGGLSMQPTPFPMMAALPRGMSMRGYSLLEIKRNPDWLRTAKQYIYDRLRDKRLHPVIAKTFPLAEARAAYEYLESNQQIGKVVITCP
jgi:NADPH:quinone reductase-like Zn-dependent oxidoreductase